MHAASSFQANTTPAANKAGISRKQGLRELGYTDEQIAAMDKEEQDDPLAKQGEAGEVGRAAGMGKAMLDAFAQGKG